MGVQNSRIEDLILGVYRETILDLHDAILPFADHLTGYRYRRDCEKDAEYVEKRTRQEGLSFCTKSLPLVGKWLDAKLSGKLLPYPEGISNRFLRSAFDLLDKFDGDIGGSMALANIVKRLRTVLFLTYKLELPSTHEQQQRKLQEFIETEKEVAEFTLPANNRWIETARHVLEKAVGGFDPTANLYPRHGPGAVATGEKGDGKWVFTHLYESLHQKYPYYDFMYGLRSNGRALHLASYTERYKSMNREPFPIAKLVMVPKDSRGPRIISCEPLELQFMQQAVARRLMSHLEVKTSEGFDISTTTRVSHINFADQSINARLALSSSRSGWHATIDLSEASDRVSRALFNAVWPLGQQPYFNALRSHATLLPNGEVLKLEKFAPMGSAICFPVESAIFFALCVAAIQETGTTFDTAYRDTYVYGDDIIVPSKYYEVVAKVLTDHGLKVNEGKSYASGYFRESCGCDAWLGHDVTPVRLRKLPGEYPHSGAEHSAWVAYSGHFYASGMTRAGDYCKQLVETVLGEEIPFTEQHNGYLSVVRPGHATPLKGYQNVQWSVDLSMPTAKVWTLKTKSKPSELDGYDRLLRSLLVSGPEVDPDRVVDSSSTQMSKTRRGLRSFSLFDWLLSDS